MFVPNFEAISHVTSVLEPKTATQVWRKKRSHSKTAWVWQKIFRAVICLKIPYHPNQPTFGRNEILFLFFFFFFCS